ncbi:monocarboxylate transporter 6-like [Genypterus blacodes]|uniref:monocarboxylate transporter 6-like n=1 Tax=Genypterus blacodes TaxID=154954 RepID=UPI003F768828
MTQRNPTGGTNDCCLRMETSAGRELVNREPEKAQEANGCESEDGGHRSEPRGSAAAPGAVPAPDGGWGWVVLVATIMVLALTLAFPSCVGIFYTDLQNEFHATNSETSWVPSIMTSVLHAGGLGFCFSFQPAVTILGHYFVRRRAFANAMSSTGTALGLCFLPFLGNYLHMELGWRGSFLVLGAMLLNCCVCGAVMRPLQPPKRRGEPLMNHQAPQPEEVTGKKLKSRLRTIWDNRVAALSKHMAFDQFCNNSRYCVYSIGITWMMLGFVVPLIYLVPYATAHNIEQSRAALLLSILGVINIVIRPGVGIVFNFPWFKGRHIYVFASALLVNGLSNSICCIGPSFPVLVAFVLIYGLSMSVVGSLMFTVLMDIVEMNRFPSALGLLSIMESVTLLIGPPLAGILVDRTGHYFPVFAVCSVVVTSSAVFLMVSFCWLDKRDREAASRSSPTVPAEPARPVVIVAQRCHYDSVPTERDKSKASDNGTECLTSLLAPDASHPA